MFLGGSTLTLSEEHLVKDRNQSKETKMLLDILDLGERQVEQGKVTRATDVVQGIRKRRCRLKF